MNQLTTIAALPGSGAGCASKLPAEVGKAKEKTPEPPRWLLAGIVRQIMAKPIREWLESEDGRSLVRALKEPAPRTAWINGNPVQRSYLVGAPAPWDDTHDSLHYMSADGRMYKARGVAKMPMPRDEPTPADMAAHPAWGGWKTFKFSDWKQHFQGEPVDTDSEGSL